MNETLSRLKQFLKRPFFYRPAHITLALGLAGFGICAYQVS